MRGRSLSVRLAVILAGVVVVVFLLAGLVVNRAASRSLDDALGPREQQRLGLAAAIVEEGLERGVDERGLRRLLQRVAAESGGEARIVDADGTVVLSAGQRPPGGEAETISVDLSGAAGGGALEIVVRGAQAPFIRAFNSALLLTGLVAVLALLAAAALVANRMTRPLRAVSAAARRLGAGDLSARAPGGPDAESADLAGAFNAMADRVERSELLRRRAASDLAHDLATPATVLESQLQAMVDGVVPADPAQLEKARAAAASLSGVIVQLGELTQAEAAPLQRRAELFDLADLAVEVIAALDSLLRAGDVTAAVTGAASAQADRGQIARALRNVVTNAIQASPAGSELRVEVGPGPIVRVIDHGSGIANEEQPFVFERFYRADRARSTGVAGSGIGLTVARELIDANGGSIEVESSGTLGTTFRVELPPVPRGVARDDAPADAAVDAG